MHEFAWYPIIALAIAFNDESLQSIGCAQAVRSFLDYRLWPWPRPWCSSTGGFRFDREHRAPCVSNDTFGYASKKKSAEPLSSVRRHYNQVGTQLRGHLENLDGGIARHCDCFIAGSDLEFLMADPHKFGFRRNLGIA